MIGDIGDCPGDGSETGYSDGGVMSEWRRQVNKKSGRKK